MPFHQNGFVMIVHVHISQLITLFFGKIITIVATRLKCAKFYFGWGSAQIPLEELTVLSQTL